MPLLVFLPYPDPHSPFSSWQYDQDATTQALVQKNDDGHTPMWNAAAGTSEASARK